MKKIFTLLLSSLFSLSLLAYDGSRLTISTVSNNMGLKFEVDGNIYMLQNNSITFSNLSEGYHDVKIFREMRKNAFGFGRRDVIYNNSICLKRGFHFDITVNGFGKVMVDERQMDRNEGWYDGNGDNGYDHAGGWNTNVMSADEFYEVKDAMRKEWFENNRMISAKTIMDKYNFTTRQVKELVMLFAFENNKLELAKYAYRKTLDKENYYKLNDAFAFNSSKEELARFIRESR